MAFIDLIRSTRCQVLNDIVEHPSNRKLARRPKLRPALCKCEWMLLGDWAERTPLRCCLWSVSCECIYFLSATQRMEAKPMGWYKEKKLSTITRLLCPSAYVIQVNEATSHLICVSFAPLFNKANGPLLCLHHTHVELLNGIISLNWLHSPSCSPSLLI